MGDAMRLAQSEAGRRLIGLLTIFNRGHERQMQNYIIDNYTDDALAAQPLTEILRQYQAMWEQVGKLKVLQLIAASEYRIVVLTQAQTDGSVYYNDLTVTEDYPHKIIAFTHGATGEATT